MTRRTLVGWIFAFIWLMALPAWAVEYRLQVTNVDALAFSSYMGKATPWWAQNEPMGHLEARLETQQLSPAAVLPGREVQLREDPAYGGTVLARISLLPSTRQQAWTTYVFDGKPGDTVTFVVRSDMAAWQEIWDVAANPGGDDAGPLGPPSAGPGVGATGVYAAAADLDGVGGQ